MQKLWIGSMLCAAVLAQAAGAEVVRLECHAGDQARQWKNVAGTWAGGGTFIKAAPGHYVEESAPVDFNLPRAGRYYGAVRYWAEKGKRSNFGVLIRNNALELVHFEKADWNKILPSDKPYETQVFPETSGPAWHYFTFTAEQPGDYRLSILPIIYRGAAAPRQVDCVLISNEKLENLDRLDSAALAAITEAAPAAGKFTLPQSAAYGGSPDRPYLLGIINCASILPDPASQVYLGFNRDHGTTFYEAGELCGKAGIKTMSDPFRENQPDLIRKYPSPQGRFVNADGEVGHSFSLHFAPFWDEVNRRAAELIRKWVESGSFDQISFTGEWGGFYDYSEPALADFRKFLKERYGEPAKLNAAWGTGFADWDAVRPPKTAEENPAAYYDFQEFSGKAFAEFLAKRVDIIRENAPGLQVTSQLSNLNIFSAGFKRMKPMDFEEIIRTAYRGKGWVGWDGYCADDYMGAEIDFLDSMTGGLPLVNHETNIHSENPDLMARTCWTMVGKGVKGIYLFMLQEGLHHDSYPKWALLNGDFSHKDKLGAASDLIQEVHRFEPLLTTAARHYAVKPVYVYYSRLDTLFHGPLLSSWGEGANSPYRVYELLRGAGYPVRYITAAQIDEGKLADAGALVLSQSERIPAETRKAIIDYVEKGGVAIADTLTGIQDRNGRIDLSLMRLFGVEPEKKKKNNKGTSSKLALQESSQGYGEVTIDAIEVKDIPSSVFEIYQQYDSEHPVLKGIAPFTFSGYGRQQVKCVDGQVIGMVFGGKPGIVVNTPGKGKTFYLAGMLGSVFGGSCSRYEFDDAHAGTAPARLIENFLKWGGLPPQSQVTLPEKIARKVRVENPLADPRGNVMFNMTSFNDGPLGDFETEVLWPENLPKPAHFFALTDSSRDLKAVPVRFEGNRMRFIMPGFNTYGALVGLKEFGPLVALRCENSRPGRLPEVAPGGKLRFTATVHNMSDHALDAGTVNLTLPTGWKGSANSFPVGKLAPWGTQAFSFEVTAPEFRALRRVRPVMLRFENDNLKSTPATAMVWFD